MLYQKLPKFNTLYFYNFLLNIGIRFNDRSLNLRTKFESQIIIRIEYSHAKSLEQEIENLNYGPIITGKRNISVSSNLATRYL